MEHIVISITASFSFLSGGPRIRVRACQMLPFVDAPGSVCDGILQYLTVRLLFPSPPDKGQCINII